MIDSSIVHIITGGYPPFSGGVGDYAEQVAAGLARAGHEVHVWAPGYAGPAREHGVTVHRSAGIFSARNLRDLGRRLNQRPGRILVQWVPHAFGCKSMNLPFAGWIWKRARVSGDRVEIMVHEAFFAFGEGSWKQTAVAVIHRLMIALLLDSASKVWLSIPGWAAKLRPWCFRHKPLFQWLPVPSNLPTDVNRKEVWNTRRHLLRSGECLVGHFGSFGKGVSELLEPALVELLKHPRVTVLLAGHNSDAFCESLLERHPEAETRVLTTGSLTQESAARYIAACDVALQPYPDGISTRRGTAMAALALGVPIVSNLGALSESLWKETDAVELAEPRTELAARTLALLENRERRATLHRNSRALYIGRFELAHTVAALRENCVPERARAARIAS